MKKLKDEPIDNPTGFNPELEMPTKLEHFPIYNRWARKNKMPVKVPDASFYPSKKVRFQRFHQPENTLKCYIRNQHIEWKGQLRPGCVYDLPIPVIRWLNSIAEPIFAEVKVQDEAGTLTETRQVGERARFSCQPLELMDVA